MKLRKGDQFQTDYTSPYSGDRTVATVTIMDIWSSTIRYRARWDWFNRDGSTNCQETVNTAARSTFAGRLEGMTKLNTSNDVQ